MICLFLIISMNNCFIIFFIKFLFAMIYSNKNNYLIYIVISSFVTNNNMFTYRKTNFLLFINYSKSLK